MLGNHDLHLLATVAGRRELSPADTFHDVLEAPDWARSSTGCAAGRCCTTTRAPPRARARRDSAVWTVAQARARRVKSNRCADENGATRCARCTAASPRRGAASWRRRPAPLHDQRADAHALLRSARPHRLSYSGAPGTQPKGLIPWFDVPQRRATARTSSSGTGQPRAAAPQRRDGARHGLRLGQSSNGRTPRPAGEAVQVRAAAAKGRAANGGDSARGRKGG